MRRIWNLCFINTNARSQNNVTQLLHIKISQCFPSYKRDQTHTRAVLYVYMTSFKECNSYKTASIMHEWWLFCANLHVKIIHFAWCFKIYFVVIRRCKAAAKTILIENRRFIFEKRIKRIDNQEQIYLSRVFNAGNYGALK